MSRNGSGKASDFFRDVAAQNAADQAREASSAPAKVERRPAYRLALALDFQLQTMTGQGLRRFSDVALDADGKAAPNQAPPMSTWWAEQVPRDLRIKPILSLNMDQGSVGWALVWFFQHIHLRVAAFNDPFHRCWNDLRAAYKTSKCWLTITRTTFSSQCALRALERGDVV